MKFPDFEYVKADSLDHLLALLADHGDDARILAGGQSLLASLSLRLSSPELLIDINGLEELAGIDLVGETLEIGALTRHVDILNSELVAMHTPLLAKAMPFVAHVAVRNRGTIGGSLSLADPAAELPAVTTALDARFLLQSGDGEREVPAGEFFHGLFETEKSDDEVLTRVRIPCQPANSVSSFNELSRRKGDFAIAGMAAIANVKTAMVSRKRELEDIRLTVFGVDDRPVVARAANAALNRGSSMTDAAERLGDDLSPSGNLEGRPETKLHLARVLLRRAVEQLHSEMDARQ